jgi:hypothetical protein
MCHFVGVGQNLTANKCKPVLILNRFNSSAAFSVPAPSRQLEKGEENEVDILYTKTTTQTNYDGLFILKKNSL